MNSQGRLLARFTENLPPGQLEWIGVRPARKAPMQVLTEAQALPGLGLAGDHRCEKTPGSARQLTLISAEYIGQVEHFLQRAEIDPALLRRNLVVSGINLAVLRHQQFRIGEVLFEATAYCHPCARMETALGQGAFAAMLGHGGICARILSEGVIRCGDPIRLIRAESPASP